MTCDRTTRLATAGESGFLSMPMLRHPAEHYMLGPRKLDESAVRREFADHQGITMSSDDDRDTLAFTVELLDRMRKSMARYMEKNDDVKQAEGGAPKTAAQRRYDKGRTTFVRVDIARIASGFRVRVSAANPKEVVGHSEEFAQIYAQAFADNVTAIADALADEGVKTVLQDGEGCEGVFAESRRRNDRWAVKIRHENCPKRINGFCSPSDPGCELYRNGRCVYDT